MALFKKNKIMNKTLKDYLIKSKNNKKTYVVAVVHKKNKKLFNTVVELSGECITIDKTPYYAGSDSIFFRTEKLSKKNIDIPMVDVYEGYCLAVHPSKQSNDIKFSKRVVDMIGLKIEQGVLENKRKQKMDMRKIIIFVFIGIGAIFALTKIF